eukprot:gene5248-5912_t
MASSTPATPASGSLKIGTRVEIIGKGLVGSVQYCGMTSFASGKWIGVALDEPKGKNDGTVQQKRYFECPPNHGMFIRQSQIMVLQEPSSNQDSSESTLAETPSPTEQASRIAPPSGLAKPGFSSRKISDDIKGKPEAQTPLRQGSVESRQPVSETPKNTSDMQTPLRQGSVESRLPLSETLKNTGIPKPEIARPGVPAPVQDSPKSAAPGFKSTVASEEMLELQRRLIEKEKAVTDLEEKLATLKQKRTEDKAKLKEFEKMKMQNQQLLEYKSRWQETQKELLQQLRQTQKDAREAKEQLARHGDETVSLQEAVEMATLDKEMAEEKYESSVTEIESLNERVEELTLELEILRNEISEGDVDGGASSIQLKNYEQQNTRLKEAIIKMKEMSANDKNELQQLQKQFKEISNQLTITSEERDKLDDRCQAAEEAIDELKEQVDSAMGAEDMVETLTDKNLALEEDIEKLQETVIDLEALRDLNEELEENHVQTEHDLREELDMAMNKERELERNLDVTHETISDYQETIKKFRDLVANLQNRIGELQQQQQQEDQSSEGERNVLPHGTPDIDFKIKFAEIKQHARSIELELRKFEVQEANDHVSMLTSFLPDHFSKRGGDYDGILLLLLLSRLQFKTELLIGQIREKHEIGDVVDSGEALKGSQGDQISHSTQLTMLLLGFQKIVGEYLRAVKTCEVTVFTRASSQYPELAADEKYIDYYIQLLSRDQLDDTVSLEPLEKVIKHYKILYSLHLGAHPLSETEYLWDAIKIINSGAECLSVDVQRLKALAQSCDEASKFMALLGSAELRNMEVKQLCKKIKRRMPQDKGVIEYPKEVMTKVQEIIEEQTKLAKTMQELANMASHKAGTLTEGEHLLSGQLEETAWDCVTLVYEKEDYDPQECLSESFNKILMCLSGVAIKLQEGEYDTEPPSKVPDPPYLTRAKAFKEELSTTSKLEERIEAKEQDIYEVRKSLKIKAEELSAANIRIGRLEKRADNAANEADTKVDAANKKLEAVYDEHAQKTKEYEETLDALQSDISSLDKENQDLRKRLDAYSKKSLLTDIARQAQGQTTIAGLVGSPSKSGAVAKQMPGGQGVQIVLKDSPVILAQLESLKIALTQVRAENIRLKGRQLKDELAALPKIFVPPKMSEQVSQTDSKTDGDTTTTTTVSYKSVTKDTTKLLNNLQTLSAFPQVVDVTRRKPGTTPACGKSAPMNQLIESKDLLVKLRREKDELQKKIHDVITKELPGTSVSSTCKQFFSREYSKVMQEKSQPVCIGKISIPISHTNAKPGSYKITLRPEEVFQLHSIMAR